MISVRFDQSSFRKSVQRMFIWPSMCFIGWIVGEFVFRLIGGWLFGHLLGLFAIQGIVAEMATLDDMSEDVHRSVNQGVFSFVWLVSRSFC